MHKRAVRASSDERAPSIGRNALIIASGTGVAHLLSLCSSPILTRIYSPEAFGNLAIFLSVVSLVSPSATLRFDGAIPLASTADEVRSLTALSIIASVIVAALVALVFSLLSFDESLAALQSHAPTIGLVVLFSGFYSTLVAVLIRERQFTPIAFTRVSRTIGQVATQLLFPLLFPKAGPNNGLIIGHAVGHSGGLLYLTKKLPWTMSILFSSGLKLRECAHRFRKFPLVSAPSVLLNSAGLSLPVLLLAYFFDLAALGTFTLLQRLLGAPTGLIISSVSQSYLGEVSHLKRTDSRAIQPLFLSTARTLALRAAPILLLLPLALPRFASSVFGENWEISPSMAFAVSLMFYSRLVVAPVSQTLTVLEQQELQAAWDLVRLVLDLGTIILFGFLKVEPNKAVLAYSISSTLSYAMLFAATMVCIRHTAEKVSP